MKKRALTRFLVTVAAIGLLALFGPEEKSLGANVRIVYLHGAWVLTAEIAFIAAAAAGALGLVLRQERFHRWSAALGRTGLVFWITYLPLSLWAMEANWNGLFLAEPRFRLALTFAIVGLLLQAGLWLLATPWLTSLANILFILTLRYVFAQAQNVMHPPPSPIFKSGLWSVIAFFLTLNALTMLSAWFMNRWWLAWDGPAHE